MNHGDEQRGDRRPSAAEDGANEDTEAHLAQHPSSQRPSLMYRLSHAPQVRRLYEACVPSAPWTQLKPTHLKRLRERLLAVPLLAAPAWLFDGSQLGRQLGIGLHYVAMIVVSLCVSFGVWVFVINAVPAALWLALAQRSRKGPVYSFVTWSNRTLGHVEAMAVWTILIFAYLETVSWQMFALIALLLLAEPLLDAAALYWIRLKEPDNTSSVEALQKEGRIHWTRRPLINLATLAAAFGLLALDFAQWRIMVPLFVGLGGGAILRLVKWRLDPPGGDPPEVRKKQAEWAAGDFYVMLAGGLTAAVIAWRTYETRAAGSMATSSKHPRPICEAEAVETIKPQLRLFVLADTQLHKLDGARFPGQMQFADALVPVARRPVEQDMLAAATLMHFSTVYEQLNANGDMPWIYLGDLADLGCKGEVRRMSSAMQRFGTKNAAGIATGNHDNSFTGNFAWSPYWSEACELARPTWYEGDERRFGRQCGAAQSDDGIATKTWSDGELRRFFAEGVQARGGKLVTVEARTAKNYLYTVAKGALAAVTPLGALRVEGRQRQVLGVFLDTTDQIAFDFGVAGEVGTFSEQQGEALLRAVHDIVSANEEHADPYFILFTHHQASTLKGRAQEALLQFVRRLEDGQPRIIGFVSAHTHRAEKRTFCLGGRMFDELIAGSTVDPPQEAAVLSIGTNDIGIPAMSLSTIPAVSRPDMVCEAQASPAASDAVTRDATSTSAWEALGGVPATRCQELMGQMATHHECRALFERDDGTPGATCDSLEETSTLRTRLASLVQRNGPRTTEQLHEAQAIRGRQLLSCLCRERPGRPGRCDDLTTGTALCDAFHAPLLEELMQAPLAVQEAGQGNGGSNALHDELVCLSWAASAVQAHKANGMEMADGLRCSFGDHTIQGTRMLTTSVAERSCF